MPTLKFVITAESDAASKAIKDFASDVGASVEEVAKKAKQGTEAQHSSLTQLTQGYQSFRSFAVDAIEGVKKVWDFAKEGAQIDLSRRKMDRLAESIGTTGDALREKLGAATGGMLSNAEQIQMGTDLMSLGLAKTSDQVVRLSSVSSKLGMDMNQLVLTLANQTTMRFDQLGVSVDGFDERLKTLKDSGLSVNDAFTEAFLQQAEEQIKKVGDATETTAGKMKRAETAIENIWNGLKEFAAEGVNAGLTIVEAGPKLSEAFTASAAKIRQDVMAGKMSVADYNAAITGMANQMSGILGPAVTGALIKQYALTDEMARAAQGYDSAEMAVRRYADAQASATAQATQNAANQAAATQTHTAVMRSYSNELLYNVQQYQAQQAAEKAAADAMAIYRAGVAETIGKVDSMAQSLAKATDAQAKQMLAQSALDSVKAAYEKGKISQEDFSKATDAILLKYDLATPKSLAMASAQQKVSEAFIAGKLPIDSFVSNIGKIPKMADDGKLSMQELATLGLDPVAKATQLYSGQVHDMIDEWSHEPSKTVINAMQTLKNTGIDPTTKAAEMQKGTVHGLIDEWSHVPKKITTEYFIVTHGAVPGAAPSNPAAGKSSSPLPSNTRPVGHATGADFVVPQGYSGDAFPMRVSSGERVIVQTPVQQAQAGGSMTIAPGAIVINGAGQNAQEIAQQVMQELGRMTNGAINAGAGMMGM